MKYGTYIVIWYLSQALLSLDMDLFLLCCVNIPERLFAFTLSQRQPQTLQKICALLLLFSFFSPLWRIAVALFTLLQNAALVALSSSVLPLRYDPLHPSHLGGYICISKGAPLSVHAIKNLRPLIYTNCFLYRVTYRMLYMFVSCCTNEISQWKAGPILCWEVYGLCPFPEASMCLSNASAPTILGFMGLGYFCIAAVVTVSYGWSKTCSEVQIWCQPPVQCLGNLMKQRGHTYPLLIPKAIPLALQPACTAGPNVPMYRPSTYASPGFLRPSFFRTIFSTFQHHYI